MPRPLAGSRRSAGQHPLGTLAGGRGSSARATKPAFSRSVRLVTLPAFVRVILTTGNAGAHFVLKFRDDPAIRAGVDREDEDNIPECSRAAPRHHSFRCKEQTLNPIQWAVPSASSSPIKFRGIFRRSAGCRLAPASSTACGDGSGLSETPERDRLILERAAIVAWPCLSRSGHVFGATLNTALSGVGPTHILQRGRNLSSLSGAGSRSALGGKEGNSA